MLFPWRSQALLASLACLGIASGALEATTAPASIQFPDLYEASILELQQGLDAGHFSSVDLVKVGAIFWTVIAPTETIHILFRESGLLCEDRRSKLKGTGTSRCA